MTLDKITNWLTAIRLRAVERRIAAIEAARDDMTETIYQLLAKKRRLTYKLHWRHKRPAMAQQPALIPVSSSILGHLFSSFGRKKT